MNFLLLVCTALGLGLILFSLLSALDIAFKQVDNIDYKDQPSYKDLFYMFINRFAYMMVLIALMFLIITVLDSLRVSCPDAAIFIKCKPFIWESLIN